MIQFADGVADVVVLGPIARIDFFVLRPAATHGRQESEQPELQRTPTFTIAMPVEALANSISVFENVRNKLIESGALKQGGPGPGTDSTVRHKPLSPNFNIER